MIEVLPEDRWQELDPVFESEFNSALPTPGQAVILADVVDNEIRGFVVIEFLARIGLIWQTGDQSRALLKAAEAQVPAGGSVIAISSDPRFDGLCKAFGMRQVEGTVFRRDF